VLLSHFMARSLGDLERGTGLVREHFGGPVHIASDLACYPVRPAP
jgi:hypothetical protein